MSGSQDHFQRSLERLAPDLRSLVRLSVPLRRLTTLRVGGPAALVCFIRNAEQARRFHGFSLEADIPLTILGGGSNILADDAGYAGLVLHPANEDFTARGDAVTAGAGLPFDELVRRSLESGLTGLEFASGIPGTLGGALVGNAGCYGRQIGEFLVEATILRRDGTVERVGPEFFEFAYRRTRLLDSRDLVLEAVLRLQRGDTAAAAAERDERIADRRRKHPVDEPSAGSWFKNLEPEEPGGRRTAAGILLEQVGAKEMTVGDAAVFPKHANIIVNRGEATSADVLTLAGRMRNAVKEKFGVELQPEVRRLGSTDDGTVT